jgi:hypothetical protein
MWCLFMQNGRNVDTYKPRCDGTVSSYALAHSHVELRPDALAKRCRRAGRLAICHISLGMRTKMGLRGCAAIL